jgi:hypothetical protein
MDSSGFHFRGSNHDLPQVPLNFPNTRKGILEWDRLSSDHCRFLFVNDRDAKRLYSCGKAVDIPDTSLKVEKLGRHFADFW